MAKNTFVQVKVFTSVHLTLTLAPHFTSLYTPEKMFLQNKCFYKFLVGTDTHSTVSVFTGFNILSFQTCPSVAVFPQ